MRTQSDWETMVKGILKAELKRRNVNYHQLAEKLQEGGLNETPASIANKISRGRFTAVFFLQCLQAIECHTLRIDQQ